MVATISFSDFPQNQLTKFVQFKSKGTKATGIWNLSPLSASHVNYMPTFCSVC